MPLTRRGRTLVAGAVVIVLFGLGVLLGATAHSGLPGTTATTVNAAFDDVGSLAVGNDVRVGGVRVGRVSDIRYANGRAIAELELTEIDTVYRNAEARTASIGDRSPLGLKIVNLDPGTPEAGELGPDEVLPRSQTSDAEEITELFAAFDKPTRQAVGSLLRETGGGMAGREVDVRDGLAALPSELPDLGSVARALSADGGANVTTTLQVLDTLSGRFAGRHQQLAQLTSQLGTTIDAVTVDGSAPLRNSLARAPGTLQQLRGALGSLDKPLADTQSAMTDLRPGARALGEAMPDVRGVLREAPTPLDKVPRVAEQAVPAVRDLTRVVIDARPLAPRLTRALDDAADPLAVLAPYSPEIAEAFTNLRRALSGHDGNRHWMRLMLVPSSEMAGTGVLPGFEDPLVARNAYPAPGEARTDRKAELDGTRGE